MSTNAEAAKPTARYQASSVDPETLMRIKNLQLRAKVVVEGFYSGLHRSPFHGFSTEFSEYRQYVQGDDLRYVDWKLYARTDRHYIKRFEDETNLRCYLLVDRSRSMDFGSLAYNKSDYATTLAATLAYFLNRQRDAVGLLTFADQIGEYVPPRYRPGHFHRLLVGLETPLSGRSTNLVSPIRQMAETTRRRSLVVLISDLLADPDGLEKNLGMLRSCGHEVLVFQILDPAEVDFAFEQPALFEDLESGKKLYVDPVLAKQNYLDAMAKHEEVVKRACENHGVDRYQIQTDRPLDQALFKFLQARQLAGAGVQRHRRNSASIEMGGSA